MRVWCSWMMLSNKLMNFMSGSEWLVELRWDWITMGKFLYWELQSLERLVLKSQVFDCLFKQVVHNYGLHSQKLLQSHGVCYVIFVQTNNCVHITIKAWIIVKDSLCIAVEDELKMCIPLSFTKPSTSAFSVTKSWQMTLMFTDLFLIGRQTPIVGPLVSSLDA